MLNVDNNLSLQIIDSSYNHSFYEKLIYSQFMAEYKYVMEANGVEEPLAQAYNGGKILKDMLGDKWDSNPASAYVGALLNHFQENSAFDLFAIDNDVLTSFAAFCQKGDDIDRLAEYLVQTGFCNYKLAYGIYGATRGFASLPKTFTSVLINGDKEYYQSFVSNVWRMLNGVEIKDAVLQNASTNASVIVESQLGSKIIENINKIEPKVTKQQSIIESVNKAIELEEAVQSPKAFMYIFDSFPRITTTKAYKALAKVNFAEDEGFYTLEQFRSKIYSIVGKEGLKTQKDNIDKAIELEGKRQDPEAFLNILDNFLKPTDAAYKKIKALLVSNNVAKDSLEFKDTDGNKQFTKGSTFVYDDNCWNFLQEMIPVSLREDVYRDLRWFQEEYKKGEQSQYYAKASRNNQASIDAFVRYLSKRKYNNQVHVEQIGEYLKKIYVR